MFSGSSSAFSGVGFAVVNKSPCCDFDGISGGVRRVLPMADASKPLVTIKSFVDCCPQVLGRHVAGVCCIIGKDGLGDNKFLEVNSSFLDFHE